MIVIGFEVPNLMLTQTKLYLKHTFQYVVRVWLLVKVASYVHLMVIFDSCDDRLSLSMLLRF